MTHGRRRSPEVAIIRRRATRQALISLPLSRRASSNRKTLSESKSFSSELQTKSLRDSCVSEREHRQRWQGDGREGSSETSSHTLSLPSIPPTPSSFFAFPSVASRTSPLSLTSNIPSSSNYARFKARPPLLRLTSSSSPPPSLPPFLCRPHQETTPSSTPFNRQRAGTLSIYIAFAPVPSVSRRRGERREGRRCHRGSSRSP